MDKKIILFTNVRDENNLKEWVAHHLLLGFDFIYIFDHKSIIPVKGQFINFNKDKFQVYVERCELDGGIKDKLITVAANIATKHKYDWMLYLDADEFLVINDNDITNVKQLLSNYSYADSVSCNWLIFGTNFHIKEPNGLIIDNYTRSEPLLCDHLKTFIRPSQLLHPNAHRPIIKNENKAYHVNGQRLNKVQPPYKNNQHYINPIPFQNAKVFIAHYYIQSEETYYKRKLKLPRDDWGNYRDNKVTINGHLITENYTIHSEFNDNINTIVKDKYSEKIKQFLKEIDLYDKLKNIHSKLNIKYGTFNEELPEQKMVVRYLTGQEKVLEIGGNIGRNSLIIASILENSANLVTLECDLNIANQLTENRDLNNFNFHIEKSALSNRSLIQKGWDTKPSKTLEEDYNWVNTIRLEDLKTKYDIIFDTLVLDCEGAFYYILMDMPQILNNIKLIIMENDYWDISKKNYIDEILLKNNFYIDYQESGGWGPCYNNFFEVWKKIT